MGRLLPPSRVTDSLQHAQSRADLARGLLSELVPLMGGAVGVSVCWVWESRSWRLTCERADGDSRRGPARRARIRPAPRLIARGR